jgi:hypothetical protein
MLYWTQLFCFLNNTSALATSHGGRWYAKPLRPTLPHITCRRCEILKYRKWLENKKNLRKGANLAHSITDLGPNYVCSVAIYKCTASASICSINNHFIHGHNSKVNAWFNLSTHTHTMFSSKKRLCFFKFIFSLEKWHKYQYNTYMQKIILIFFELLNIKKNMCGYSHVHQNMPLFSSSSLYRRSSNYREMKYWLPRFTVLPQPSCRFKIINYKYLNFFSGFRPRHLTKQCIFQSLLGAACARWASGSQETIQKYRKIGR